MPLHAAKQCKYLGDMKVGKLWLTLADLAFVGFAVAFFVTRLVMYPYVVWSVTMEAA